MGTGAEGGEPDLRRDVVCIDVSGEVCPMTWVRTRLALERSAPGEILHVILGPGEMLRNVPRNAIDDGHEVLSCEPVASPESEGSGRHRLVLRRKGPLPGEAGSPEQPEELGED